MLKRALVPALAVLAAGCAAPTTGTAPGGANPAAAPESQVDAARYRTQGAGSALAAIVPVDEKYHGKTYEALSAEWWNWAFNQPLDGHPMLDTDGDDAATGQNGAIWFLGGAFRGVGGNIPTSGPIVISRHVEVPAGKALFFPIVNTEADNSDCGGTSFVFPFADAFAFVTARLDSAYDLSASIDGEAVPDIREDFRVDAGPFNVIYGPNDEENLTSAFCGGGPGYRGTYKEAASAGYWLLLRPLPEGHHTIRFTGALPGTNPFELDITYELDVLAPGEAAR